MKKTAILLGISLASLSYTFGQGSQTVTPPVNMTAEQDHQNMMDQLHITSIRPGANGNDPKRQMRLTMMKRKPNPYPALPDPFLTLNNE